MSAIAECPFCNTGERILKSNKLAFLILSNPRKTIGHFLVCPKRHIEEPWELTKEEILDIYELIFFVESKIIGKLGDGSDIRQNYRPFMKQSRVKVDHLHYHVIPRSNKDNIYQISEKHDDGLWTALTQEELDKVRSIID